MDENNIIKLEGIREGREPTFYKSYKLSLSKKGIKGGIIEEFGRKMGPGVGVAAEES